MTLDVRLLGQLAVSRDGNRVELRSRPAQLLLAYLVLYTGHSIPRDKIAGALWPDSSTNVARKNLRQTLWRLRRAIGNDCLEVDPRSLRLKPEAVNSDVANLVSGDVPDEPEALASAVESYGELLPGHYGEWIQAASGPVRATWENRMSRLVRALAAEERWEELRGWSEQWIANGSGSERAYRALMRAYAGMDDLPGVADAYHRCVLALRHGLGVEPSAKTRGLFQHLIESKSPPVGPESPASDSIPMPSIRFVGSRPVIEHSVVIGRPHDEVFTAVLDPGLALLYRSNVLEYELITGRPGELGTQVRATKKLGSEIVQFLIEVVEADYGRWLVSRTIDSPFYLQIETHFEDLAAGTRMSQRREIQLPESFSEEVDHSVLLDWYAADVHSDFAKLKHLIETR